MATAAINLGLVKPSPFSFPRSQTTSKLRVSTLRCSSATGSAVSDNIDEKEFPEVQDLEFLDCVLEEGGMPYIPPKWWHYVRSLSSMSVNFWWSDYDNSASS